MTWGELKKKAEELSVPDEAEIICDSYGILNNPKLEVYVKRPFFELQTEEV